MRRRLRKKRRLGEFQELGFGVRGRLREGTSHHERDAFIDRLIVFMEARRLGFGGSVNPPELDGFVQRLGRGTTTEEDRVAVAAFLGADEDVVDHELGPLVDAWYAKDW